MVAHPADGTHRTIEEQERPGEAPSVGCSSATLGHFSPPLTSIGSGLTASTPTLPHAALDLDFLREGKNVVPGRRAGSGKTMLAKNIAHAAVMGGYSAIFITAADLLLDLASQESTRAPARRVKHYARVACLCIDEIWIPRIRAARGRPALPDRLEALREQVLVLTTNKSFSEWSTIFPGAACATALVDRVVHHADVILIEGKSYRLRESTRSEQTSLPRGRPPRRGDPAALYLRSARAAGKTTAVVRSHAQTWLANTPHLVVFHAAYGPSTMALPQDVDELMTSADRTQGALFVGGASQAAGCAANGAQGRAALACAAGRRLCSARSWWPPKTRTLSTAGLADPHLAPGDRGRHRVAVGAG
ncbi:MAG: ATP-binding protein [Sandaracinaceae bacterium]|nr:ATP-binding protein [Sandaracinaceae bacterium]